MSATIQAEVQNYDDPMLKQEQMLSEKGNFTVMPSEEIVKKYISKKTTRSRFEDAIVKEANFSVLKYILSHLDLRRINKILLTYSHDLSSGNLVKNVKYITRVNNIRAVVDLKKVNDNKNLNQYFYGINDILPGAGIYFGCVETHRQRNKRIHAEKKKFVATLLIFFEFIFHRVLPKTGLFRGFYLKITGGRTPVLSLAETLGRLVYNGFDIIEYKTIRSMTYFVVMKTRTPTLEKGSHSGLFMKQQTIEKNGEIKLKYRVRTRHIYSEYLPDHVLNLNGSGRPEVTVKDFRYNAIGRVLFDWTSILLGSVQLFGEYVKSIRLFPRIDLEDIFYIKYSMGKGGIPIKIYKFRTMVKHADKMDNLIIQYNSYGNPVKDPRITPFGRFMRKVWIDELPQLYSLIKGDIKLVGIRPMRESDWRRYPDNLKAKALQFKPGLMGVQYATLCKNDFMEHIRFFNQYLDQKKEKPFKTDVYYFFRIIYYIFFKGVRSD
ncbi:MAG: sugar transferase [Bacteroidales bacterium]|nr:sugar transferase [Bacteroidales bacterium]